MTKGTMLYEGKAKILYQGTDDTTLIQYFKDDVTANNAEKKDQISNKGIINNHITAFIMEQLEAIGISTHFIERINEREQLIKKVDIIPLEVIVRNVIAGSMARRFGLNEGEALNRPLVEFSLKDDELGDPLIAEEHILALDICSEEELSEIFDLSLQINDFLRGVFAAIGITLVDFKLEFGRHNQENTYHLILADEFSPDNCRLWDMKTGEKLDKDRFRRDLGGVGEAYEEVAKRLNINF